MIATELGRHAASLIDAELDDAVLHAAKRCVLDTFAAAICGAVHPPATLMQDALAEELDHGGAQLVPSGRAAPIRTAALINGAAALPRAVGERLNDGLGVPVVEPWGLTERRPTPWRSTISFAMASTIPARR